MGWIWRDNQGRQAPAGWRVGGRGSRGSARGRVTREGEGNERTSESDKTTKSNHSWWPPVLFMREFSDCPDTYCSCGIAGNSVSKIESNA